MNDIEQVLKFWIDEIGPDGWYKVDDAVDQKIRAKFTDLWQRAAAGDLTRWTTSPRGSLALLILTDQFPRNMFRGTWRAYSTDQKARAFARHGIDLGHDQATPEPERQFFYLPLMHSETLTDQERCVRQFLTKMPEAGQTNLPHAVRHREVIRQFGRFPSRNKALGREDTERERAYRAAGGYMS